MPVSHWTTDNARDLSEVGDIGQALNLILAGMSHIGIAEMRVGSVTTTILDTSKAVTFDAPFPDANFEVFIQANANVGVSAYPSNFVPTGFTLNLSAGVNANFSYFAVGSAVMMQPIPVQSPP